MIRLLRLAYPLDKQIFDMNILIVVDLPEKKQPDSLSYTIYRAARMLVTTKAVSPGPGVN